MAKGVEYISPVDVISGIGTTGSWVTVDLSAYIPANAVAAIFDIYNASAAEVDFGVRAVGSTDSLLYSVEDVSHKMDFAKLNAAREFQFQQQTTGFEIWLVGYVPEGAGEFVTNVVDVTPGSDATWEDIDVGALVSDGTAGCAFFRFVGDPGAQDEVGLRMNGSTDTFLNDVRDDNAIGGVIGVDGSELCEGYSEDVSATTIQYLGCVYVEYCNFNTNATDYSTGTTGSWVTTDLTEIPVDESPGMAALLINNTGTGENYARLRRTGDTPAYGSQGDLTQFGFFVHGFDSSGQIDQIIEGTSHDLKLIGWFIESASSSSSSSSSFSSSSSSSSRSSSSSSASSCVPTVIEDIAVESSSSSSSSSHSSSSSSSSSSATPGTVTWGHHTGVVENYDENFTGNTTGWTVEGTPGNDNETIDATTCDVICVFERWYLGAGEAEILIDLYQTGSGPAPVIQFRTATTGAALAALSWQNYIPPSFTCLGWVQIRLVHV